MEIKRKRPLSVWLTMMLLLMLLLMCLLAMISNIYHLVVIINKNIMFYVKLLVFGMWLSHLFAAIIVFWGAIVIIWQGQPRGRLIGAFFMILLLIILTLSHFTSHLYSQSSESIILRFTYNSNAELVGALGGYLLMFALLLLLFFRFTFSKASREYFTQYNPNAKPITIWLSVIALIYLFKESIFFVGNFMYALIGNVSDSKNLLMISGLSLALVIIIGLFFSAMIFILRRNPKGRLVASIAIYIGSVIYLLPKILIFIYQPDSIFIGKQLSLYDLLFLLFYLFLCYFLPFSKTSKIYFLRQHIGTENQGKIF